MSGRLSLNGTWQLTFAEFSPFLVPQQYTSESFPARHTFAAPVPAPIHQVLLEQGLLDDPNLGLNSLKARWVEEQAWIYRHEFTPPDEALTQRAWLLFAGIEADAVIWLNGEQLGTHANAHRPTRFDVTGRLRPGANLLVVQVTTGMFASADKPGAEYTCEWSDLLTKRPWHRKAQYQCGWDWNPRMMNVGLVDDVSLQWEETLRLDQVAVYSEFPDPEDLTRARLVARAVAEGLTDEAQPATLTLRVDEADITRTLPVEIQPGDNTITGVVELDNPRLWWPRDLGNPERYTVHVTLTQGSTDHTFTCRTGVRHVTLDQRPHPDRGRYFIIRVNGEPVFCKGGNWVPPDLMPGRVTDEHYRELVQRAAEANFNTLRIWGGGIFADHAFLDACDELGLLVWHDFLFACAKFPGDDPDFAREVREETTCAVRELSYHPSLVVWCGNNEVEWGDWHWGYDDKPRTHPHYALFHHDIPQICHRENPTVPYWVSSPYSPDYEHPNDPTVGDQHPWYVSLINPGPTDWWEYRTFEDRFPNEGGVLGASTRATLRQFLPEDQRYLISPTWQHHDNPFAAVCSRPGEPGRVYLTYEFWTGKDPLQLDWETYAFGSSLLQAEGLQEYITNYRRRKFSTSSAIFWMYNDSWPATHGWTILDYYLREKLSYHPVRRAFAPVSVVVAHEQDQLGVYGINDTRSPWSGRLRYGLFLTDGELPMDEEADVTLPPNAATLLATIPVQQWQDLPAARKGALAVLKQNGAHVAQHRLLGDRFKDMVFADPQIDIRQHPDHLELYADVFAWGVCLDLEGERRLPDNCFDLLPEVPYRIRWDASLGEPKIAGIGSRDIV